ncbi:MAG TPA: hypothetical protein VIM22_05380 [Solirubrobacteraceae bacterium]
MTLRRGCCSTPGTCAPGVALLRRVAREEPANVAAWGYLDIYGHRIDQALAIALGPAREP